MSGVRRVPAVLVAALLVAGCAATDAGTEAGTAAPGDAATDDASDDASAVASTPDEAPEEPSEPDPAPEPAPEPEPEPEPAYAPPADWEERAVAAADVARRSVVAIGWRPPTEVLRRMEAGWLIDPTTVATSPDVVCDAQRGTDLRVRTFAGEFRTATIVALPDTCGRGDVGVALLRLDRPVEAPTWRPRGTTPLEVGEPLLAIGHANTAAAIGGWLVLAGPVVHATDDVVWADIAAPVRYQRINEFFGGGSSGAAVIDLDGALVTILCCEIEWGPQVNLRRSERAEPLLRRRVTLDEPYFVGGPSPAALAAALSSSPG